MKFEQSVGAVVFYQDKFLVLRYGHGHWGLVKGHIEEGETKKQTLIRELEEETGITESTFVPGFKEEIGYYYKSKGLISKKVTFFLLKVNTMKVTLSPREHTDFKWLTYEEAIKLITFENVKRVLRKAKEFLN